MNPPRTVRGRSEIGAPRRNRGALCAAAVAGALALTTGCGPSPDNFPPDDHVDVLFASTEPGGGALAADYDFSMEIPVFESASLGGFTLYSATDPGFMVLDEDEPDESVYVLEDGTEVSLEVVALDAGVRFRFAGVTLDEVGDLVVLGTVPDLHEHPEWQVAVPEGVTEGDYSLSFKLTTDSPLYEESGTITATLALTEGEPEGEGE